MAVKGVYVCMFCKNITDYYWAYCEECEGLAESIADTHREEAL